MEHQALQDEIMKKENEIVIFETEDKQIKLSVNVENETVWLSEIKWQYCLEEMERRSENISIMPFQKMK